MGHLPLAAFVVKARSLARSAVAKNILLLKQLWVWPIVAAVLLATIGWFLRRAVEESMLGVEADDGRDDLSR